MKNCIRCGKKVGFFSKLVNGICKECNLRENTYKHVTDFSMDNDDLLNPLNPLNPIGFINPISPNSIFNSSDECEKIHSCDNSINEPNNYESSSSNEESSSYSNSDSCDSSSCDSGSSCDCDCGGCD